jgi:preprotein translocase subunit SecD
MKRILLPLLVALLSCDSSPPAGPEWGVEFVFKVHRPTEVEQAQGGIPRGVKRIERRLALAGFTQAHVIRQGDDMKIRVPGVDASNLKVAARAISGGGTVRIHQVADTQVQATYQQSDLVPPRHWVVSNRESHLLLKHEAVLAGTEILDAWVEPDRGGTSQTQWRTVFEVSKEAARRLDAAAAEVAGLNPPGVLAIVVDDLLLRTFKPTAPVDREARITGLASEGEARELATLLLGGGYNPVWKRSDQLGTELKAPYTLTYYGTPRASTPGPTPAR